MVRASPGMILTDPERARTVSATVHDNGDLSALIVGLAATSVDTTIVGLPVNKNAALCAICGNISLRRIPVTCEY